MEIVKMIGLLKHSQLLAKELKHIYTLYIIMEFE